MVRALTANRKRHIVNDSVRTPVGAQHEVRSVFCFAEHVRNTVPNSFFLIIRVKVVISVFVRRCHEGSHHERIHLGLRFLQVVTAVVVAAFQRSGKRGIIASFGTFAHISNRACAILSMACRMEPRFSMTTSIDTVELEGCGTHHGINLVTDDERTRNIVAHLDTQARVRGERKVPEFTHLNGSGLARN